MNLWNLELELNAISWLQFFAPKSTRKKLCEQMLSTHRHRQDKKPKCCSNCPNPGRGCRASPHFSSARFAHFSRIPHFLRIPHFSRIPHFRRVSLFRWISAGFGKFGGGGGVARGQQCIQGSSSARNTVSALHRNTIQKSATHAIQCSAVHCKGPSGALLDL